ncbi:Synaptogyrin-4 [Manis javanica]|nr:Synaptogyrin-4 [Manis javanica]
MSSSVTTLYGILRCLQAFNVAEQRSQHRLVLVSSAKESARLTFSSERHIVEPVLDKPASLCAEYHQAALSKTCSLYVLQGANDVEAERGVTVYAQLVWIIQPLRNWEEMRNDSHSSVAMCLGALWLWQIPRTNPPGATLPVESSSCGFYDPRRVRRAVFPVIQHFVGVPSPLQASSLMETI